MKNKIIFQISFGLLLMGTFLWFLQIVGEFTGIDFPRWYWFIYGSVLDFGIVLFAVGILQLYKSTLIPSIIVIISLIIGLFFDAFWTFDIYRPPFGNIEWLLYSVFIIYIPKLFLLIFLVVTKNDNKNKDKILISIIFIGIALIIRIVTSIISGINLDMSSLHWSILNSSTFIFSTGGMLLAVGAFMIPKPSSIESVQFPSTQSPRPIVDINRPMAVGDWLLTYLIMIVPIVNIVMLFIWAFGSNVNIHRNSWAKATLIWFAIVMALYFLFFVIIIGLML